MLGSVQQCIIFAGHAGAVSLMISGAKGDEVGILLLSVPLMGRPMCHA